MNAKIKYLNAPIFVWWNITYVCNLHCLQCYSDSGRALPDELSTSEAKDVIKQLADMKVFYIYFLGGEPLLRKDFFELAEYARSLGISVMMSTNGWFLTEQIAVLLEKIGFMHVRVSIDGASAQTHDLIRGAKGSFEKAVSALKLLKQTKIPRVGISTTVLNENIDEMPKIVELALSLKIDEMQLVQLCSTGRGSRVQPINYEKLAHLREIFESCKNDVAGKLNLTATEGISLNNKNGINDPNFPVFWGCPAGRTCFAIEAEGTIRPCILYKEKAGNVREGNLKDIWEKSFLFQKMRTPAESCLGCSYKELCSGECPVDSCTDHFFRREFAKCSRKGGEINAGSTEVRI